MAVELSDLVDSLKREVEPPGADLFPTATGADWVGYLSDAFWKCRIEAGLFVGYAVNDADQIVPTFASPPVDLGRDSQQVVVLFAALGVVTNVIRTTNTSFTAKAGTAEFSVENSAGALKDVLAEYQTRRQFILTRLSDLGHPMDMVVDLIDTEQMNITFGDELWVR